MSIKTNRQCGFTVLEISLVVVVVGLLVTVGFLAYKRSGQTANVSTKTSSESEQKKIVATTADAEKTNTVEVPPTPEPVKPAPTPAPPPAKKAAPTEIKKKATYINFNLQDVQIADPNLKFAANWAGSYDGTCALKAKHLTNGTSIYKEIPATGSNCMFELAKADFAAGEWKYTMYFYSKDGTVKGEIGYKTFTL